MTKSNLYDNFSADRPSVCMGQTIFGLTSTTGKSDIFDINFVDNVEQYITVTTGIRRPKSAIQSSNGYYTLSGVKTTPTRRGIYINNGKKAIMK